MKAAALKQLRRQIDSVTSRNATHMPLAFFEPVQAVEILEWEAAKMIGSDRPPAPLDYGLFGNRLEQQQINLFTLFESI